MSSIDEVEYWNLMGAVKSAEKLLHGVASGNTVLGEFVKNAKDRMEHLESEGLVSGSSEEKKKRAEAETHGLVYLVQKEARLSAAEKQQYGSFLEKDFFTRDDFDDLDKFYGSAWDRLTDDGKAHISHRVWEGIREGEYQFADLPQNAKKKEAEYLYSMFTGEREMPEAMKHIPEKDKQDFILAMKAGHEEQAFSVLNRECFKETVSLSPSVAPVAQKMVAQSIADKETTATESEKGTENRVREEPSTDSSEKVEAEFDAYDVGAEFDSSQSPIDPKSDLMPSNSGRATTR